MARSSRLLSRLSVLTSAVLIAGLCAVPSSAAAAVPSTGIGDASTSVAAAPEPSPAPAESSADSGELSPEQLAAMEAAATGQRVEVVSERTETRTVWANPDGTMTAQAAGAPVRVRQDSAWAPVDLSLQPAAGRLAPKASPTDVSFSAGGTGPAARIADGPAAVGLGWSQPLPAPQTSGAVAAYDLGDGARLEVAPIGGGFRAHVVLSRRPAGPVSYRLPLSLSGLSVDERSDGSLLFTDPAGAGVFEMAPPVLWDARTDSAGDPAVVAPVTSRVVDSPSGPVLELSPPSGFLDDPATVYPVTVDPTVTTLGAVTDTYVKSNVSAGRGSEPYLWAGLFDDGSTARAMVKFDDPGPALPTAASLQSAELKLFTYLTPSCSARQLNVKRITSSWAAGTIWSDPPGGGPSTTTAGMASKSFAHGFDASCPEAFETLDVTGIVADWLGGSTNHGFKLVANDEAAPLGQKRFCSFNEDPAHSSCNTAGRNPALSMTYTLPPNGVQYALDTSDPDDALKHGSFLRPYRGESTGDTTPTLNARCVDPDAVPDQCRVSFEVLDQSGNVIASGLGSGPVPSGSVSSWTVPASAGLVTGGTYSRRVKGTDAAGNVTDPSWSPRQAFHIAAPDTIGEERRYSFETQRLTDRDELKANVATGNLLMHSIDLSVKGTGIDLIVDRYYNSRSATTGPLGKGWTLGIGHDVKLDVIAGGSVRYTAPSGYQAVFPLESGNFDHPPGVDAELTLNQTTGQYELTFHNGATYFFEPIPGGVSTDYRQKKITDRSGNAITLSYNTAGHLSAINDTQNRNVNLAYVGGKLDRITDSSGRANVYTYTTSGDLETVSLNGQPVSRYRYTGGLIDQFTSPDQRIVNIGYKADGTSRVDFYQLFDPGAGATQSTTSFAYTSATTTQVTDPNGNDTATAGDGVTTYTYDDRGRVTKVVDQLGHKQDKTYTSDDNVTTLSDALNNISTYGWDRQTDNLESAKLATGAETTLEYTAGTAAHSPSALTDPQGNRSTYTYDTAGRLTTATSAEYAAALATINYNQSNGTVNFVDDGNGTRTSYSYTNGNLTGINNPAPLGDVSFTVDGLSRLQSRTDGKGQTTTYSYDPVDRVDVVGYQGGTSVDHKYDFDGNLTEVTDPTGITTLTYNKLNRNDTKTLPSNHKVRYAYDATGNLTTFTNANLATTYTYDQANRLQTVLEPGASSPVDFDYDNNDRRTKVTLPTSPAVTVDIGYDNAGRQTSLESKRGTTVLTRNNYTYTKNGADTTLRQSMTDLNGTTTYGYDLLNRLTSANGPGMTRSYAYNIDFNRTSKTENGATTSYGYNAANQLTTAGSATFNYDANGNQTGSSNGWNLTYNTADNTTSITAPGQTALTPLIYTGTSQDQRTQAGNTTYINSALGVSSETTTGGAAPAPTQPETAEEDPPLPANTIYFTREPNGTLISRRTDTGTSHYYLFDGLGSVVGLVNNTGQLVNTYRYDPYGKIITSTEAVTNPFGYASGYTDRTTGLIKFGLRYYNPDHGRFTQPDPTGEDLHYTYAEDDPCNKSDPGGAQADWVQAYCDSTFAGLFHEVFSLLEAGQDTVELIKGVAASPQYLVEYYNFRGFVGGAARVAGRIVVPVMAGATGSDILCYLAEFPQPSGPIVPVPSNAI